MPLPVQFKRTNIVKSGENRYGTFFKRSMNTIKPQKASPSFLVPNYVKVPLMRPPNIHMYLAAEPEVYNKEIEELLFEIANEVSKAAVIACESLGFKNLKVGVLRIPNGRTISTHLKYESAEFIKLEANDPAYEAIISYVGPLHLSEFNLKIDEEEKCIVITNDGGTVIGAI